MRSKLVVGGLTVAVAFLLATNPVVVNAAGLITSAQIKNNTIKSKDIKDNQIKSADVKDASLTTADLAAGTIPAAPTTQVKRFFTTGTGTAFPASVNFAFTGFTTVTVDGNDAIVGGGTVSLNAVAAAEDYDMALCYRPTGTATPPTPLGGTGAFSSNIDAPTADDNLYSVFGAAVLTAGSYDVGVCVRSGAAPSLWETIGWVQVLNAGTTNIGKPASASAGARD